MEKNEIKKLLYKKNPKASFLGLKCGVATYMTEEVEGMKFAFKIPVDDMGEAEFLPEMDSKYLGRWLTDGHAIAV